MGKLKKLLMKLIKPSTRFVLLRGEKNIGNGFILTSVEDVQVRARGGEPKLVYPGAKVDIMLSVTSFHEAKRRASNHLNKEN